MKDEFIKRVRAVIERYMPMSTFMKELEAQSKFSDYERSTITPAFLIKEKIVNYKLKQAKKKGKVEIKNDPRKKAFIVLSDSLEKYSHNIKLENASETEIKQTIDKVYNSNHGERVYVYKDADNLYYVMSFKGHICLPFPECFIYTTLGSLSQVIDVKDNGDGSYSGSVYMFSDPDMCTQMSFNIVRHDWEWKFVFQMSLGQRPLGQGLSNLAFHLFCMTNGKPEVTENLKNLKDPLGSISSDIPYAVINCFKYLSSYRCKMMYQVSKDESFFVYSEKSGEKIEEYIKERYPEHSFHKVEGWLANGYWKFLQPNEFGSDAKGKRIKGMTWEIPYEKKESLVTSGEQTTRLVPIHALERAKERYNMDLTSEDLEVIMEQCLKGKDVSRLAVRDKFGTPHSPRNELGCYRLKYKGQVIDVALAKGLDRGSYRIATFMPRPENVDFLIRDSKDCSEVILDAYK